MNTEARQRHRDKNRDIDRSTDKGREPDTGIQSRTEMKTEA